MRKQYTEDVMLIAGTVMEHEVITNGVSAWHLIPNATSFGGVGEQAEKKEKTNLSDTIKKYGSGMQDAPDKSIKGQVIPPQTADSPNLQKYNDQQMFIKRCKNKEEFNVRIVWPDGEINSYLFKALGFEIDDNNQEEWKMFTVNGAQNTRTLWDVELAGTNTVTTGNTITDLTVTTVPLDLDRGTDSVTYSSSDTGVATVDASTGVVTGVAAGDVTIIATFRGVSGELAVTVS